MIARVKVGQNERLLVESGVNQYKLVGPGWVWLIAGQQPLAVINVGLQEQALIFDNVQTVQKIPVEVTVQVLYQIEPTLFTDDLLPNIPALNEGGWPKVLKWQTEYVVRQLLVAYPWQGLGRQSIQERLERELTSTLAERLKEIALNISNVFLIKTALPIKLQRTIIQAEQDEVEARGRAMVLKKYFEIFGNDLPQAMPYIVQWELMNLLHKNGNPQLMLRATGLSLESHTPDAGSTQSGFQMRLPVSQERREVGIES